MMNYVMLNSFQHLIKNISETLNQVQGDDIFTKCHSELVSESDML